MPEHGAAEHRTEMAAGEPHAAHDASARQDTQHAGHGAHEGRGDHAAQFRDTFWASLALAVPVVFFSPMFADLLGYAVPTFAGSRWIAPALGTVLFLYGGRPFLTGGWSELRARQPGMMLLIAMAITVAFVASWVTVLGLGGFDLDFWWELALLVVIMLLGHWLEMRALGAASGALEALAALLPDSAERVTGDSLEQVPLDALRVGDVVLVRPGARVPADAEIVSGRGEVDESMVTGESRTVTRATGDTVVAGTVVSDSAVRARVSAVGDETTLAGIQRLVAQAQSSTSRAQALADRAAALLFYFATVTGAVTFASWLALGAPDDAVTRTVTVLVIACPHALGLAIPLVIAISTERAASAGVLVKDRLALERMRTVDVVLFDKTGTLTTGRAAVTDVAAAADSATSAEQLLGLAAAAESDSEHPVARAIRAAAPKVGPVSSGFESVPGHGVRATVDGREVAVGGPALLRDLDATVPEELADRTAPWARRGASILHVLQDGVVIGALAIEDEVRAESASAVRGLHGRGVRVAMVTGDAQPVADSVAGELDIDEVFAEVLPRDKDAQVAALQARGLRVAMVGDGVNDAPALARAEVGIAIGAGTDVAVESADVVLVGNDPRSVLSVIALSRASYAKMWQNLVWATGYNLAAVPLAAGVLAFGGIVLSPAVGAVLMSLSTVVVALNAQLLRRLRLDADAA